MKATYLAVLICTLFATSAFADGPLKVVLEANRVVTLKDGKEQLAAAASAKPGDIIEYRATYKNESAKTLNNVVATLPVPAESVEYLAQQKSQPAELASVDGKTYSPLPMQRQVTLPDGSQAMRSVPLAEYRFLRWQLGALPAGSSKTVSARVRVSDTGDSTYAASH